MIKKRVQIEVKGLVQGVSYRYNTVKLAQSLNLVGTVMNKKGGSVIVIAEGSRDALNRLVDWCKEGPRYARVTQYKITWDEPQGGFDNVFKVI